MKRYYREGDDVQELADDILLKRLRDDDHTLLRPEEEVSVWQLWSDLQTTFKEAMAFARGK